MFFNSLNAENANNAACLCRPSSLATDFLNWSTAIYFPPPADEQYTFCSLPGIAFSTIPYMLASVGIPAIDTCSSLGPMQVCIIGFFLWVTALTLIIQHWSLAGPVYPGNSGIAYPVLLFWSSFTLTFGITSPSITYSAFAIALSLTVKHLQSSTASLLSAPATASSSYPIGVVGGSKHEPISIAGSTPMLIEIGNLCPNCSALSAIAPICLAPGVKNIDNSSLLCIHRRWIVTSLHPVSGCVA